MLISEYVPAMRSEEPYFTYSAHLHESIFNGLGLAPALSHKNQQKLKLLLQFKRSQHIIKSVAKAPTSQTEDSCVTYAALAESCNSNVQHWGNGSGAQAETKSTTFHFVNGCVLLGWLSLLG